jgi:hypothetical protein
MEFDLHMRPRFRFQVGPGFVNRRPLAAQGVPVVAGLSHVLDRMIAHGLIVGQSIPGAEIEHVVLRVIRTCAKREACETRHANAGRSGDLNRNIDIDDAILEGRAVDVGEDVAFGLCGKADRFATEVFDRLGLTARNRKGCGVSERKALLSR